MRALTPTTKEILEVLAFSRGYGLGGLPPCPDDELPEEAGERWLAAHNQQIVEQTLNSLAATLSENHRPHVNDATAPEHAPVNEPEVSDLANWLRTEAINTINLPKLDGSPKPGLVNEIANILKNFERNNQVQTWPEEEQELFRRPDWESFEKREEALQDFRRKKAANQILTLLTRTPTQSQDT